MDIAFPHNYILRKKNTVKDNTQDRELNQTKASNGELWSHGLRLKCLKNTTGTLNIIISRDVVKANGVDSNSCAQVSVYKQKTSLFQLFQYNAG